MSSDHAPQLDPSQQHVVHAEANERLIVTAGAGQGKTEVVLARIAALAAQDILVQDEVLVLSFSRAAVNTVRRRARGTGVQNVPVRTFDSFAAQILLDAGELKDVRGFEPRIRRATEILRDGEADVEDVQHVILDESQDLVGDRAEMVLALFEAVPDAGFTVLGDPLQGIYDFQLDDESHSKRTSAQFLDELEAEFGADRTALIGHYRAQSDRMRGLVPVADRIRAVDASTDDTAAWAHTMLDAFRKKDAEGRYDYKELDRLTGYLDPEDTATTAVLAATNYEVLLASDALHALDVRHVVRRKAREMGIAPWVGRTLVTLPSRKRTREDVEEALSRVPDAPADGWARLREASGESRTPNVIDLGRLLMRLRGGIVPLDLMPSDESPITASTVHRAKGLEFDHVIDLVPNGGPAAEMTWRNLRRKYVGTSRARESLFVVPSPNIPGRFAKRADDGRWIECGFRGPGRSYTARIEIGNEDVGTDSPLIGTPEEARHVQSVLASGELIGRSVDLVVDEPSSSSPNRTYSILMADGTRLGRMSTGFSWAVRNAWLGKGRGSRWPYAFEGVHVTSIEAVAGEGIDTEDVDLGPGGYWLLPRLAGLARPSWE